MRNIEVPNLSEEEILVGVPTSSSSWDEIIKVIEIPQTFKGCRTLDIGAGGSNLTATLLGKGAKAYALDPKYKSRLNTIREIQTCLNISKKIKTPQISIAEQTKAALKFTDDLIDKSPENYIAGFASSLPFADNTFDFVFSLKCITFHLDLNFDVFSKAVSEAIRVTKPNGKIQIFPFNVIYADRSDSNNPLARATFQRRKANHERLLSILDSNEGIDFTIRNNERDLDTLVITKRS